MRRYVQAFSIVSIAGIVGCMSPAGFSPPMAAASGVARADSGKGPRDYRIIPLKSGEEYKAEALQEPKAGTYAFAPKGSSMFGFSPTGAIVQLHDTGPFRIHWHGGLHTLDDPDAKSVFRFAKGMRVLFKDIGEPPPLRLQCRHA